MPVLPRARRTARWRRRRRIVGRVQMRRASGYERWLEAQANGIASEIRDHADKREAEWSRIDRQEMQWKRERQMVAVPYVM